jgi:Zn-dependent protease with chaperone function
MRGVTRSFWVLVAIAAAVEGLLVYLAVASLNHVLPCWLTSAASPRPSTGSCGESVAVFGYNSWVPGALILAFVSASLGAGLWTLFAQIIGTRRALRQLGRPIVRPQRLTDVADALGVDVDLIDDPRCFCCCAGVLHPHVIISTEMLSRLDHEELTAVLAHERAHALRRDPARAAAVRVAARALFYLPLASHLADKALVASELGADSSATRTAGQDALVGALLKVLGEIRPALGSATEMASLDALDSRIEALRTKRLPRIRPSVWIATASLIAAGALCAMVLWLPPVVPQVVHLPSVKIVHHGPAAPNPPPGSSQP